MKHILKCPQCGNYSLRTACKCGGEAVSPQPPKYSPEDKYGKYRREVKREEWEKKGFV
ncbi:MAG: RNA-protein complex protein Nop10 [Nanoarchaeota archaeon]|nr:RNA-protein complex protein Nop10 [Nanoarchaeota archaeon]